MKNSLLQILDRFENELNTLSENDELSYEQERNISQALQQLNHEVYYNTKH